MGDPAARLELLVRRRVLARLPAALAAVAGSLSPAAWAQSATLPADRPGFSLTASTLAQRDNNVFLLPDGASPRSVGLSTDARGDTIVVPSLELDENLMFGRQRVLLDATLDRELLLANPNFDVTDFSYSGSWHWAAWNEWSGELFDSQQQQRTSFADAILSEPNHQTTRTRRASADYRPRPDRRIGVIYTEAIGTNSTLARRINDFRITSARAELGVDWGPGAELVLGASSTRADYPNQQILFLAPVDNSYRQAQFDLGSQFDVTEKIVGQVLAGYAKRRHPDVPQRNFGGLVGNLGVVWLPTAKLRFVLGANRDLNDGGDLDRIYTVTTTLRGEAHYKITYKSELAVVASAARTDFKGDPAILYTRIFGFATYREDQYSNLKASWNWAPRERWSIELAQILGTRNSNRAGFQFRDWKSELNLQYRIGS